MMWLSLPGLHVPLIDPGAQPVTAADDAGDAWHSHPGMEFVVRMHELRHESVDLAPIEDLLASSR